MSSGNTCTSTASWLPSGPGTVVVPMKEPTLISDSDIRVIPTTRMSPVMCSLTSSPLRDMTDSTSPSTASMVPRTRVGDGGCWAIAYKADATTMATATSGRMRVERRTGMNWSPVAPPNMGNRCLSDIPVSNLCEIGLNQRAKLGRHLGALAEPEFEPAHRLVQQHAEPVGGFQSARPGRDKQRCFQRHIYEICNNGMCRQQAGVDLQRGLAMHAKRRRVDQEARARQQIAEGIPCDGVNTGAELIRQRLRALEGAVRQMHAADAALDQPENHRARRAAGAEHQRVAGSIPASRAGVEIADKTFDVGIGRAQFCAFVPQRIGCADRPGALVPLGQRQRPPLVRTGENGGDDTT